MRKSYCKSYVLLLTPCSHQIKAKAISFYFGVDVSTFTFCRTSVLWWGHCYPCVELLVTVCRWVSKSGWDSLTCMLCHLHTTDSLRFTSGATPADLLAATMVAEPFQFLCLHMYKHWWGSSPESSVPLPHSMWQDWRSTDWAMPARHLLFRSSKRNFAWKRSSEKPLCPVWTRLNTFPRESMRIFRRSDSHWHLQLSDVSLQIIPQRYSNL